MTSNELALEMKNKFDLSEWPETYEVDADTYLSVCITVFNQDVRKDYYINNDVSFKVIPVALGIHNGIMFLNVELLLKREE